MQALAALGHALTEIRRHSGDRGWWAHRIQSRLNAPITRRLARHPSIDVVRADWDTLVVLDACRYDLFEETVDTTRFDGYERVASPGSSTDEWLSRSFASGSHGDTVYVTGNPMVSRHATDSFHRLVEVWLDAFDGDLGSVPADAVTDAALDTHEQYPDKRLVVHYLQPHYPFVRDPQLQFTDWGGVERLHNPNADHRARDVWDALGKGLVTREEVWAGYRRNLEYVTEAIAPLLSEVEGKTVVTSDHGNLIGERGWPIPVRLYGHPPGCRRRAAIIVPWGSETNGERRTIRVGTVESKSDATAEAVSDRLSALGYVE